MDPIATALAGIRQRGLEYVEWWYTDLSGRPWRFMSPTETVTPAVFIGGNTLSARSLCPSWRGLVNILPDAGSVFVDPLASAPTAAVFCDLREPRSGAPTRLEARHVLRRAEGLLRAELGTGCLIGCEAEFMALDDGRPAAEHRIWDLLRSLASCLTAAGIPVEAFRHGPGPAQGRVQMRQAPPLVTADRVVLYRRMARALAERMGLALSFLPKPLPGPATAGMPIHLTLHKGAEPSFHDASGWSHTSALCRRFAGGLLRRAGTMAALFAPTTNSYRRLSPGVDAPTRLALSAEDHRAAVRVPARSAAPAARRLRFGLGDPSANPYLYFAAVLMAGLEGVEDGAEPEPERELDGDLPDSLEEALRRLRAGKGFLLRGGVFTEELLRTWSLERWRTQVLPVRSAPHPEELRLEADGG